MAKNTYSSAWEALPTTLASGNTLTDTIDLGGLRLFGIIVPSSWTTANMTFQMSPDGGTSWADIRDQNGIETLAIASATDCIIVDPKIFAPLQYLRIRSGSSETPITQTDDAPLTLILRAV